MFWLGLANAIVVDSFGKGGVDAGGLPAPTEGTIDLVWDENPENLIPLLALDFPDPQIDDIVELRRYVAGNYDSYDMASATITSLTPVNVLDFDLGGNWPLGDYEAYALQYRSAVLVNVSNLEAISITGDVTAPTLSSPVDTAVDATTGSGSVSTNEADGTLYWVVSTSVTAPTKAQVKLGQMHTGAAAADFGSQAVSATGVQSITGGFTGLTPGGTYYAHYMHEDSDGNQSTVSTGNGFSTPTDFIPTYHILLH